MIRTPSDILGGRADRVAVPAIVFLMWVLDIFDVVPFFPSVALGFVLAGAFSSMVYDRALIRSARQEGYKTALEDMVQTARAIQAADLAGKPRPGEPTEEDEKRT